MRLHEHITRVDVPEVDRRALGVWTGTQRIHREDTYGRSGSVEVLTAMARTRRGVYRKLARQLYDQTAISTSRRQVQKAGDGAVQYQAGGFLGERAHLNEVLRREGLPIPSDPALDWPDRYPVGGE